MTTIDRFYIGVYQIWKTPHCDLYHKYAVHDRRSTCDQLIEFQASHNYITPKTDVRKLERKLRAQLLGKAKSLN